MSGHSRWSNIKHRKDAVDSRRGSQFTKMAKLIAVAAKKGGPYLDMNPALRMAVEKARSYNMAKDSIERAIKKGAGTGETAAYIELTYEGYAQGGVALLIEALTDNRNRTTPEIRKIFEKGGGSLGEIGCVGWMFKRRGLMVLDAAGRNEDDWMALVLEAGADDLVVADGSVEVLTPPDSFEKVLGSLKKQNLEPKSAQLTFTADTTVAVDAETARKVLSLMEAIDDHDDIQNVYTNMELPRELESQRE